MSRRPGLVLILGSLAAFGPMSIDMYLPAFPALETAFATTPGMVAYTLSAFFIGLALGQLVYGPLADRFGRKPPLLIGLALYVLASIGCAYAASVEALIAWRALEAFGACGGLVMSRAMVRDLFDVQESARVFSLLLLVMGVAPIVAPFLGGIVLKAAGWPGIFWALAAFGAAVAAACALWLPETHPPEKRTALGLGAIARVYAGLLAHRAFLGFSLAGFLPQAGMFAYIAGSPHVFITLNGVPADRYGLLFGLNAGGLIAASQVNGWLLKRAAAPVLLARALVALAGFAALLMLAAATGLGGFFGLLIPLFGYLCCLGFIVPNAIAIGLGTQTTALGQASAMQGALQFGTAFLAGSAVGAFQDATARPMAATIAVCAFLALGALAVGRRAAAS